MRIVPFNELRDPHDFFELMEACFNEIAQPEHAAEIQRWDARRKGEFGFGIYSGRTLAAFVGVMDLPVRTRSGNVETALGLHHVATHPAFARRGLARELLDFVHNRGARAGRRFSFLFTNKNWVAYPLYRRVGYEDLRIIGRATPRAVRIFDPGRKRPIRNRTSWADLAYVEALFAELTAGRTGMVVREPGWLNARLRQHKQRRAEVFVDRDGYAATEPDMFGRWIREFLARDRAAFERLLDRIIATGCKGLVDCCVLDPILAGIYSERGFRFRYHTYHALMAKPLAQVSVRQTFGPHFFWTTVDQF
ncbi:MAG: GNAT family N-acetyltransferase [candidate division WOR-3 bacterium]|nr:GNAT family N-acetyltransferase [candidate division WOR-3 bacterium]